MLLDKIKKHLFPQNKKGHSPTEQEMEIQKLKLEEEELSQMNKVLELKLRTIQLRKEIEKMMPSEKQENQVRHSSKRLPFSPN